MRTYDKGFLPKVKDFHFDEAHGFIVDKDSLECDEDMFTEEILALLGSGKDVYRIIHDAYKLGYMRAIGLL